MNLVGIVAKTRPDCPKFLLTHLRPLYLKSTDKNRTIDWFLNFLSNDTSNPELLVKELLLKVDLVNTCLG